MPVDPGAPGASSVPPGDDLPGMSPDGAEAAEDGMALVALMAKLADRTIHLYGLLDTLEKDHQLHSLIAELERTDHGDALATVLPSLTDHTEDLTALITEIVASPDHLRTLLADLADRANKVDTLITELEQAIARSSRDV